MPKSRSHSLSTLVRRIGVVLACMLLLFLLGSSVLASSVQADESPTTSARIIYHFTEPDQLDSSVDISERESTLDSVCTGEVWQEDDHILIRANAYPTLMSVSTEQSNFRVLKDYASTSASGKGTQDITTEAQYNAEDGTISLPCQYAHDDLTVAWYVSAASQENELPLQVSVAKTINGISSVASLEHSFKAATQTIDLKLFDNNKEAGKVEHIRILQGGSELTQFVYQNGSISIMASPLGGPLTLELTDGSASVTTGNDLESAFNTERPLISLFSAANPVVGERFKLDADSALIRTCEPGGNMAQVMGWPEKSNTYGFAVHFNWCVNPEVVNADQNHIAPGGTVRTPGGGTYDYSWVKGMHFAWGECYGNVDDNGTGEPKVQSGWVEVTNVDYYTQTVSYRFFLDICSDIDGHDMQSIMGTFQIHEDLVGYLELKKQSALPAVSSDNQCYSLEGARYGIYADENCTDLKEILTTDAQGCARSKALLVGTYYVKELSAPEGYALDINAHNITVAAGTTRTLTLEEVPQSDPTPLLLAKHDSDYAYNGEHNPIQGGASSLKDAEFSVTFYPTLEDDHTQVEPLRTWVVKTDSHGFIDLRQGDTCKVSGDEFFVDTTGAITLPLGTYEIRETKAPTGYKLNESSIIRKVTGSPNGAESVSSYDMPIITNSIIRGGLELEKRDLESGLQSALGAATLEGTLFTITNDNSHEVRVNGIFYQPGEVCANLVVHDGKAGLGATTLPYGDYTLQEVAAGDGYNVSDNKPRSFSIERDGQIVRFSDSAENSDEPAFKNQVKRGDLNFIKVHESTSERLSGIPFRITSKTTGESHIIVSDANGIVDTSASWIEHTKQTNENDEGDYAADRGIWFGKTSTGSCVEPRNNLGALPFDVYTLEELSCEANEGFDLVKTDFTIYRDKQELDFGVVENHDLAIPWITTMASDSADHDKLIHADNEASINDQIRYGNLQQGETYTLQATLINKETGEQLPGATGKTTFTAETSTGSTQVSIPVNLLDYTGKDIVVYETLLHDDRSILEHQEKDNTEQTVSVIQPRIGTSAIDAADGDHEVLNDSNTHIVDTVYFANLVPGEHYTVIGTLMMKSIDEEGNVHVSELVDESGNAVSGDNAFTPQTSDGSVEVTFSFDASELEPGNEIVVFEQLKHGDTEIAVHNDPEDENQTLRIIEPDVPLTPNTDEPNVTSETPLPGDSESFFAKTGSAILPWIIGLAVLLLGGLAFIAVAYHQHRKAEAITAAIAQNMLGSKNIWHP